MVFLFAQQGQGQYLSDNDKYYREIERLQKEYDDSSNIILQKMGATYFTKENALEFFHKSLRGSYNYGPRAEKALQENIKKHLSGPYPTRYQDPVQYMVFAEHILNIKGAAKKLFPHIQYTPKFGTFYINSISAERKYFEQGYLLLIHSRFMNLCNLMGRVALQMMKRHSFEDMLIAKFDTGYIGKIVRADQYAQKHYIYTFLETCFRKWPPNDSLTNATAPWLQDHVVMSAGYYWDQGAEMFVVAHEYTHALLKHTKETDDNANFMTDTSILHSWKNETEADSIGQELLIQAIYNRLGDSLDIGWNKYTMYGGLFFLHTLKHFEEGYEIMQTNQRVPVLSQQDFNTITTILQNKHDTRRNLERIKTIHPYYRKLEHPPTEVRIALIKKIIGKHILKPLHDSTFYNNVEFINWQFAEAAIFSLNTIGANTQHAFHNYYKMKDEILEAMEK